MKEQPVAKSAIQQPTTKQRVLCCEFNLHQLREGKRRSKHSHYPPCAHPMMTLC